MSLKISNELSKLLEIIKSSKPYIFSAYKAVNKKGLREEKNDLISNPEINCILNVGNRSSKENNNK